MDKKKKKKNKTTKDAPPVTVTTVATTAPQPGSTEALSLIYEQAIERTTYTNAHLITKDLVPLPFDTDMAALARLDRCIDLQNARGSQTAELACHLFNLREGAWVEASAPVGSLPAAENFQQVVDTRLNMSPAKANKLASQWASFLTLGLHSGVLSRVVWDRLCELGPGIRAGVIDEGNITEWLPLCEPLGQPYALRSIDLQRAVKEAILESDPDSGGSDPTLERMRTVRITMTEADCELYLSFQELLKRAASQNDDANFWPTDGRVVVEALAAQTAQIAEGDDTCWRHVGLARIKELVERICPGVSAVFVAPPNDPNYAETHIGSYTVHAVYQGFAVGPGGEEQICFVVATGPAEAAATLGISVDTIREFPLQVSDFLKTRVAPVDDSGYALPASKSLETTTVSKTPDVVDDQPTLVDVKAAVTALPNKRPVYTKLSSSKQRALASKLGTLCRDNKLAVTTEYAARKSAATQAHSGVEDAAQRGNLVYADVVNWLFDLADAAGIVVDISSI